jgi:hypothetical protein
MNPAATYIFCAALAYGQSSYGQQAATPQPAQLPTTVTAPPAPCAKSAPSQPHKEGWLERKARDLACKKNSNLCSLPSSTDDAMGSAPSDKPCTPNLSPQPLALPATPAQQTGIPNPKPELVCPPKSTLIPGQPYCIFSDRKVVDAIPLPSGILSDSSKSEPVTAAK